MKKEYADFLIKKTIDDYNLIAFEFSQSRKEIWPDLKDFLETVPFQKGEKILDVGCGNARLYKFFEEKGTDYWGIDASQNLIEIAKSLYPKAKIFKGDIFHLPFEDNFFEKVCAVALFHHIPCKEYRLKVLREIKRVLKKDGKLFLTVWNLLKKFSAKKLLAKFTFLKLIGLSELDFGDIFYPWKNQKGEVLVQRYIHLFSEKELKKLLKSAGFGVEKISKNDNISVIACPYSLMDKTQPSGG